MRGWLGAAASAVVLLVTVVSSQSAAADTVRDAVDRGNRAFLAAYASHDSAKLAALYAPDAAAFPPGGARADGREAVRKVWQGAMDAGVTNVKGRTVEVAVSGNFAYESAEYSLDAPSKHGKLAPSARTYVVVYERRKT